MIEAHEKLFTPKELDEKGVLSLVTQWKERELGRLKCYRFGRKILYGEKHLADYFALNESNAQENEAFADAA